jgi:hypothetical protein
MQTLIGPSVRQTSDIHPPFAYWYNTINSKLASGAYYTVLSKISIPWIRLNHQAWMRKTGLLHVGGEDQTVVEEENWNKSYKPLFT